MKLATLIRSKSLAEPTGQFVGDPNKEAVIEIEIRHPDRPSATIKTVIRSESGQDVLVGLIVAGAGVVMLLASGPIRRLTGDVR